MKTLTMETVLKSVKEYFLMTVGMMLYSFGWIGCILPVKGTGGGAAGLSLVVCSALEQIGVDIQIGTMVFVLNAILLLVAGFIVGWNFGVKTIFCVVVISLGMNFWQDVLPEGDFLHLERILAVILGGILAGVSRGTAAEFSFFMAIPTMVGASGIKLLKFFLSGVSFTAMDMLILLVGCTVSYIVSLLVIKGLMNYVRKHSFSAFGVYRIVLGIAVLLYFLVIKK